MRSRLRISCGALAVGVGLVLLTAPSSDADTTNLDFESGVAGWSAGNSSTTLAATNDPAHVHGGTGAAAVTRIKTSGTATVTDTPNFFPSVASGAVCSASGWVQGPAGKSVTIKLLALSGTKIVTSAKQTLVMNGTWQQLPLATMTMPSTASSADLQFYVGSLAVNAIWYLDTVSAACTTPTPPDPNSAVDVSLSSGLWDGIPIATFGAYPYDYDDDGLTDVLINPHNEVGGPRLYHNDGAGSFHQVYRGAFISRSPSGQLRNDRHGCAWSDVNLDGLGDFYCTMGANHGTLTDKANELWIQQPDGGFVNQAEAFGVVESFEPGRDAVFLDVNHDPYPDLFTVNNTRTDGLVSTNHLYLGEGGTSFTTAPEYGVDQALGGIPGNLGPVQAVDYNHDGWSDLFVATHVGLRLYRNDLGTSFTDVTASSGLIGGMWRHAVLADVNGDTWLDAVGLNGNASQFRIQLGSASAFGPAMVTRTITNGRQVGVADVDGDSDLDVYIVVGTGNPDIMMINDGSGLSFSGRAIPQATTGDGQSVTPFDYDQDGKTELIVMRGYSNDGPILVLDFPEPPLE